MKKDFLGQIARGHGTRQIALAEIKARNLPVVIYGAGLTGDNIYEYLINQEIVVLGFMVDKGYGEHTQTHDLPVELLEYYDKYDAFCVIIAFQNVTRGVDKLKKSGSTKIKSIYCLCNTPAHLGLVYDYEYVQEHRVEFEKVYESLVDTVSKKTMLNYVNSIVSNRFDIQTFMDLYDPFQYFAKDVVSLGEREVVLDCGAFDGDTLLPFRKTAPQGKWEKYYALEPDSKNAAALGEVVDRHRMQNVEVIRKGVWDAKAELKFTGGMTSNSGISSTGNVTIEVDSIDNLFFAKTGITFIKMDIQGAELRALHGAANVITRDKPTLAICVYHKSEDLFKIPLYLKSLVPEYKMYMRHHALSLIETVLYAVK